MGTKNSVKELTRVVEDWVEQDDDNRTVIVIAVQKTGDESGDDAGCVLAGSEKDLVGALRGAILNDGDKTLAKLINATMKQIMLEKMIHDLKNENK